MGKLFNKILAIWLEHFLHNNDIIDTSLQKGFLSNINGTMEHMLATSAIIQNAVQNGHLSQPQKHIWIGTSPAHIWYAS